MVERKDQIIQPGEQGRIPRAAVIHEIWVLQLFSPPQVYVSLLHKKSRRWWETPGGEIFGTVTEASIKEAGTTELSQEAITSVIPRFTQTIRLPQDPTNYANFHLRKIVPFRREVTQDIDSPVESFPQVQRQFYTELPEIVLGRESDVAERREHDSYRLLDVSRVYYSAGLFNEAWRYMQNALIESLHNNSPVSFTRSKQNPVVLYLEPLSPHGESNLEILNISQVSLENLYLYLRHIYSFPKLITRFTEDGKLLGIDFLKP